MSLISQHLKWDSDFFNFPVLKITSNDSSMHNFDNIIGTARDTGYKLIYLCSDLLIDFSDYDNIYTDKRIIFRKTVHDSHSTYTDTAISNYMNRESTPALKQLAYQSGTNSRFKLDKHIPNSKFEELYELWVQKSLNGELAEKVFVHYNNTQITGMVTLSTNNKEGQIGLIAIDKDFRGLGIGEKLLKSCERYLIDNNIPELTLVTQEDNTSAVMFYSKFGFEVKKKEYIYHIWIA